MIFDWSNNENKGIWFGMVPMMMLGAATVALFATGTIPLVYLWATLFMWIMISGLGVAVGYHRVFSHRTHKLPVWKENIILWFGALSAQGSALFWVAVHRGYHHPYADTERDVHSPVVYGKWHAFLGWINPDTFAKVNLKYSIDLLKKPNFTWFHKYNYEVLWGTPLVIALFDWRLAMAACFLPGLIGLLQDNLVNVVGHTRLLIGYRNFETRDQSHNNFLWGYFGWGQGWHNNHHAKPAEYDFGRTVSGRWWEFDPAVIFLPFLGKPTRST